jgi:hypothetical protein
MDDRDKLEKHLEHCSARVQRNTTVVTAEDLVEKLGDAQGAYRGQHQLHISKNTNIRKFIPQLTLRGSPDECRDITRVCVAPTLLGCILGYAVTENDFFAYASDGKEDDYKGGYKIYALPVKASLRPNKSMVPDVQGTDEHWVVSYSPETTEFIPESAGRFFCSAVQYEARAGKKPAGRMTLYVEITKPEGLWFSKSHFLTKGYWIVTGTVDRNTESWKHDQDFVVSSISRGEYMGEKVLKATLLSHDSPMLGWSKP